MHSLKRHEALNGGNRLRYRSEGEADGAKIKSQQCLAPIFAARGLQVDINVPHHLPAEASEVRCSRLGACGCYAAFALSSIQRPFLTQRRHLSQASSDPSAMAAFDTPRQSGR